MRLSSGLCDWLARATLALSILSLLLFGVVGIGRGTSHWNFDYEIMHRGGKAWVDHTDPYDLQTVNPFGQTAGTDVIPPFSYPPNSAFWFVPLGMLSFVNGARVWTGLNLIALAAIVRMSLQCFRRRSSAGRSAEIFLIAWVTGLTMVANVLWQGQTSLIECALIFACWTAHSKNKWLLSGIFLGAAALKPQLGLLVGLWMVLERQFKTVLVSGAVVLMMATYPMAQFGIVAPWLSWIHRLGAHREFAANRAGNEFVVNFSSLFEALGLNLPWLDALALPLLFGLWINRKKLHPDDLLALIMTITLGFLFVHDSDYVCLIPLIPVLWLRSFDRSKRVLLFLLGFGLFIFPRRILRELDLPLLLHWQTVMIPFLVLPILQNRFPPNKATDKF